MEWKELWSMEIESSKSVALRISVSEREDTGTRILSIRKWIRRGTESYPTKDGFAIQVTLETLDQLITALGTARQHVSEN